MISGKRKERNKSVLILGANGYLGRHLAKLVYDRGYQCRFAGTQRSSVDGYEEYSRMDINDLSSYAHLLEECDYVFCFAGLTGTFDSFIRFKEFFEVNELGLLNLLEGVKKINPGAKIIFPSSRLVYKGKKNRRLTEDSKKEFKTIYAMNKYACERYLKMYHESFGIDYLVFRICVPYGNVFDNSLSFGTLGHMISKAQKGNDITLYGDGFQKRSFVHVHDLSNLILIASIEKGLINDIFNIGGPDILSIRDVAEMVSDAYGVDIEYVPWPEEHRKIESGDTIFDSTKLMDSLQYQYEYNFRSWIAERS